MWAKLQRTVEGRKSGNVEQLYNIKTIKLYIGLWAMYAECLNKRMFSSVLYIVMEWSELAEKSSGHGIAWKQSRI